MSLSPINNIPAEILRLIMVHLNGHDLASLKLSNLLRKPRLALLVLRNRPNGVDLSIFNAAKVCRLWRVVVFKVIFQGDTKHWESDESCLEMARLTQLEFLCREANAWRAAEEVLKHEIEAGGHEVGVRTRSSIKVA